MDLIKSIREKQTRNKVSGKSIPPMHYPEMLYIGCIDARLDPIDDIGIEKGKSLIFRNPAALVLPDKRNEENPPRNLGIGATLEFFLSRFPAKPGVVRHVVVSGHTDCGAVKACHHGQPMATDHYLPIYLENLATVRANVMRNAKEKGWDDMTTLQELEKGTVRQSVANLLTYPAVVAAMKEGTLQIHGWVIDTATQQISEMNLKTLEFSPMSNGRAAPTR